MTSQDIIEGAFRAWGRGLYKKTSLSQVAAELGVSKTALYRHFSSKENLLEGMHDRFFDDFAEAVRPAAEKALGIPGMAESSLVMLRAFGDFFCRRGERFIFFLAQGYGKKHLERQFESRGIGLLPLVPPRGGTYPSPVQLSFSTLIFWVAQFHRGRRDPAPPGPIDGELGFFMDLISGGLGFGAAEAGSVDFPVLEARVRAALPEISENDRLLQAVAETVAEAGPWNATMNMVARRSGLSKSGLYAHFSSRQDMVARLFITEFERLLSYVGECRDFAGGGGYPSIPPEQRAARLYLVIFAIAEYLRSRPQILSAVDWLRTRNLDLGTQAQRRFRIFENGFAPAGLDRYDAEQSLDCLTQWLLFLVVSIFIRSRRKEPLPLRREDGPEGGPPVTDESFRAMFRFVCLGLQGTQ